MLSAVSFFEVDIIVNIHLKEKVHSHAEFLHWMLLEEAAGSLWKYALRAGALAPLLAY